MKNLMLLFLLSFGVAAHAESGKGGHGTVGYLCTQEDGSKNVIVYDIFKLKHWGESLNLSEGADEYEMAKNTVAKLARVDRYRSVLYSDGIDEFNNRVTPLEHFNFKVTLDYDEVLVGVPEGCTPEVIVNQSDPNSQFSEDRENIYRLNVKMWDLMTKEQRAVVLIHEVVYKEMIASGIHSALYPVNLTANIISGRIDSFNQEKWDAKLKELKLIKMQALGDGHYKVNSQRNSGGTIHGDGRTWYKDTLVQNMLSIPANSYLNYIIRNGSRTVTFEDDMLLNVGLFGESKTLKGMYAKIKEDFVEVSILYQDRKLLADLNIDIVYYVYLQNNSVASIAGRFNYEYAPNKFLKFDGECSYISQSKIKECSIRGQKGIEFGKYKYGTYKVTGLVADSETNYARFLKVQDFGWLLLDDNGEVVKHISQIKQHDDGLVEYMIFNYEKSRFHIQLCRYYKGDDKCEAYGDSQGYKLKTIKKMLKPNIDNVSHPRMQMRYGNFRMLSYDDLLKVVEGLKNKKGRK